MKITRIVVEFVSDSENDMKVCPVGSPNQFVYTDTAWSSTRPVFTADLNLMLNIRKAVRQRHGENA